MAQKSIVCPICGGGMSAMFTRLSGQKKGTVGVPNRKYCAKCDKVMKFTITVEC